MEGEVTLKVHRCEVTLIDQVGKVRYHNAFITDWTITDENVATGRARWKIENENNNTLKTKGYHLEHNFGHGKKHLSSLLVAMNILALLRTPPCVFAVADSRGLSPHRQNGNHWFG